MSECSPLNMVTAMHRTAESGRGRRWRWLWGILIGMFIVYMIGVCVAAFAAGMYCGKNRYTNSLIAVKYIDGKYGAGCYGVEVTGHERGETVEISAKIFIYSISGGYYHDFGLIGTASSPQEARRRFGEIQWDGKGVSIGPYRIERKQYENHR